ncbi:MAG TPA: AmmeMemoRadiSam system protein B, partial [Syntrophales bacterium]|nr:AmmeMemoRadiSam system protein B [Syntrophales bacterium]
MDKPILRRDIQPIATEVNGRRMIAFHDPFHIADHRIALDFSTLPILQMLDGEHDLADIQAMLTRRQGGQIAYMSEIASFIESLDKACLLESLSFNERMCALRSEFGRRQVRLPIHAGRSYLSDPRELAQFIQDAEDKLDGERRAIPVRITGILAPHIDINVAKDAYVNAYSHLKGRSYDTVVILGINHHSQDGLYSISDKHYATPFGEIKTDADFVRELRKSLPEETFAPDDFGHMTEHSIEFQTVFLGHYLKSPFKIVPILCGGVHEFIYRGGNIFADDRFRGMLS